NVTGVQTCALPIFAVVAVVVAAVVVVAVVAAVVVVAVVVALVVAAAVVAALVAAAVALAVVAVAVAAVSGVLWSRLSLDGHDRLFLTTSTVVDRDLDDVLAGFVETDRRGESAVAVSGGWRIHGSFVRRCVDHIDQQRRIGIEATPVESEGVTDLDGLPAGVECVGIADLGALRRLLLVGGRRRRQRCGRAEGACCGQQEARAHPRRGFSVPEGHRTLL